MPAHSTPGVEEEVLVVASGHTDESVPATNPRAAMSAYSTSVFERMSLHSPAGTPTNLFLLSVHRQ